MTIKNALAIISDGHTLIDVMDAKKVCEVLGVGWSDSLIDSYKNQEEANPTHDPKGLWLNEDKPTSGVYTLNLSYYIAEKLGVKSNAGIFHGRGSQARANSEAVAGKLGVSI